MLAFCRYYRLTLALAAAITTMASVAAQAQGKLDAAFSVTLAGIPIGKGTWTIEITDTHFSAAASGATTGLMKVFTGGHGVSTASGVLAAGQPLSSVYASTIFSRKKSDTIRLTIDKGAVKELKLDPPQEPDPARVPVTEAHQRGVRDPMTALLLRTPGTGDPVSAEACQRTVPVFDGRIRYDLQLAFKRMEQVKTDKGYSGPVVVCSLSFTPIAGYVPSRLAIRYISERRDMEVWLAPVVGTRVLVPYRAESPTPIGPVVFEATQFASTAIPIRASANGVKAQ